MSPGLPYFSHQNLVKIQQLKNHWHQGSLPENNRTFKKIPTLFQHYWINRLQINFIYLFIYFSTFVMLSHWWPYTRRFSHIWLYTRYESRNLLKCFYIMATWSNNELKHGKFLDFKHVFVKKGILDKILFMKTFTKWQNFVF
jgi:hypothetical protein